jgi:ribose-phosphate pyrophosphokinase
VWKVDENYIGAFNTIEWDFENESELMQVAQLKQLIVSVYPNAQISLHLPFLPYGRQDKNISNESTFALHTFATIVNALQFHTVSSVDPHSDQAIKLINRFVAIDPMDRVMKALVETQAVACYPDGGAATRYGKLIAQFNQVLFEKVRDQATGNIVGIDTDDEVLPLTYLIIDDICDGGRTFVEAAKVLYERGAKEVHLYVSHGIFSKGTQVLRDAGIKRIFTYKGEV